MKTQSINEKSINEKNRLWLKYFFRPYSMVRSYALLMPILFGLLTTQVFAEPHDLNPVNMTPNQVVEVAIRDLLNEMKTHEAFYRQDLSQLDGLVRQNLVRYFDFLRMTQLTMARFWNRATASQRTEAAEAFQALFIATYGQLLFDYRNTSADVETLPGATEHRANLQLEAHDLRGEKVMLILRLEKEIDQWKIIDVNVDGVSYVVTMRGQFSEPLARQGVDGLIRFLKEAVRRKAS